MNNQKDYEDFGHRIEGARKFMFGLSDQEISNSSTPTLIKQATKNNLWPEPELGQKDRFVEYIISKFRSCVRAKINSKERDKVERYIRQVQIIKELMEDAQTEEEALDTIRHIMSARHENGLPVFDQKLIFTKRLKVWELTRSQMEAELFGVDPKDIPVASAKNQIKSFPYDATCRLDFEKGWLFRYDPKGTQVYRIPQGLNVAVPKEGTLVIVSKGEVMKLGATEEEYELEIRKLAKKIMESQGLKAKPSRRKRKPKIEYEHLKSIVHIGSEYRNGQDVGTSTLHRAFSFYGGQFGNYIPKRERVQVVNMAYDAFCDLTLALGVLPEDISFKGKLSIAFGARGSGSAGAHYELERRVINLTRINGAGSLSHEWFHGLDHHLSILEGSDASLLSARQGSLSTLNQLANKVGDLSSAYRVDALALDAFEHRSKPYWADKSEMLARAFSCYVIDKLDKKGVRDDYLGYEFEIGIEAGNRFASAYPQEDERLILNGLFDEFFCELIDKGIMTRSDSVEKLVLGPPVRLTIEPMEGKKKNTSQQLSFI